MYIERLVPKTVTGAVFIKILIERLLYSPLNSAFSLYMLARLEGKSHNEAVRQLKVLYLPILQASWKYLTIIHILNFSVVPPMVSKNDHKVSILVVSSYYFNLFPLISVSSTYNKPCWILLGDIFSK